MTAGTTSESVLTVIDADLPDSALSVDELGSRIVGMAGRLAAATCHWLRLVAEFDAREGCARFGLGTTARWLAHHCGIAHRTAVEHVRVARALVAFPRLADEMGAGRLSYSQIRAISRVPAEGEDRVVDDLIELALHGTAAQLEYVVRGLRTVEHNNEVADGEVPEERLRHSWASDSQWRLNANLHPERGAVVKHVIDRIAKNEGITTAEALVRMAEIALAAMNDVDKPARPLRGDERAAVVVHFGASAADPRSAERDGVVARIDDGPGLPRSVVERLLCSGGIRTVVHDELGNVCNIGRRRRTVTERQFRALVLRDRHCTHPGCTSKAGLQAHHVKHWIDGGRTELANLVLLCERDHHALHDGEFEIEPLGRQRFRFVRSDGRLLVTHPEPAGLTGSSHTLESQPAPADDAAETLWGGERLDRQWAVSVLAQRRANAQRRAS